ncbi:AraC family transcriptional regulator [Paenibacillus sp. LHD-117]|uniref:AraC family transcriptional regulator n=1 Tax=Paenibacillus sp. LHD-117 TaxID=3071412 RepID=UPI0027DFAA65|nr:AraC family transcriptional regulator [Paenibacillus sp. LHD-117]MDQ6417938.1 AraC family transcriptional regulator [Paenibacillus sp. LHD-117]
MFKSIQHGVYGYRFSEADMDSVFQLYCAGYYRVTNRDYSWHGQQRQDGPLYLFQYTISGFGAIVIDGVSHAVSPNQAFMVEIPGDHHYYLPPQSDHWEFIFILIRPYHLTAIWEDIVHRIGHVPIIPLDSSPIHSIYNLYREASTDRIDDITRASALVYHFIMELYRFSRLPSSSQEEWPQSLRDSIRYMNSHYHLPIGLEQIADHAGLSKYHFNRLFTRTTGQTPIQHLTQIRLEKAVELIKSTSWSLEEIAKQVGYTSGSYFTKVFKQHVGCSPSDYRHGNAILPVSRMNLR